MTEHSSDRPVGRTITQAELPKYRFDFSSAADELFELLYPRILEQLKKDLRIDIQSIPTMPIDVDDEQLNEFLTGWTDTEPPKIILRANWEAQTVKLQPLNEEPPDEPTNERS